MSTTDSPIAGGRRPRPEEVPAPPPSGDGEVVTSAGVRRGGTLVTIVSAGSDAWRLFVDGTYHGDIRRPYTQALAAAKQLAEKIEAAAVKRREAQVEESGAVQQALAP